MIPGIPDPRSSPVLFLQGFALRLPFIIREKKDRAELVEWLDGIELALAAFGPPVDDPETPGEWRPSPEGVPILNYPPGNVYVVSYGHAGSILRVNPSYA